MPALIWDEGTACGFFVSLHVLHCPRIFGARASWAAGVRSRLPAAQRDFLERVQSFLPVPLSWLYLLPAEAKTVAGALYVLAQLPLPSACHHCISLLTPHRSHHRTPQYYPAPDLDFGRARGTASRPLHRGIIPRPNTLLHVCEAWSDLSTAPTRLRFSRYLSGSPQTSSELARRLRLRPPTVTHHLNALRLADLASFISADLLLN